MTAARFVVASRFAHYREREELIGLAVEKILTHTLPRYAPPPEKPPNPQAFFAKAARFWVLSELRTRSRRARLFEDFTEMKKLEEVMLAKMEGKK